MKTARERGLAYLRDSYGDPTLQDDDALGGYITVLAEHFAECEREVRADERAKVARCLVQPATRREDAR